MKWSDFFYTYYNSELNSVFRVLSPEKIRGYIDTEKNLIDDFPEINFSFDYIKQTAMEIKK